MESKKSKMLRIVNCIYDIKIGTYVNVINNDNVEHLFKCKCFNNNYDLYDLNNNHISWGLSCETLDDMRESLLKDYLDGLIINIKIL